MEMIPVVFLVSVQLALSSAECLNHNESILQIVQKLHEIYKFQTLYCTRATSYHCFQTIEVPSIIFTHYKAINPELTKQSLALINLDESPNTKHGTNISTSILQMDNMSIFIFLTYEIPDLIQVKNLFQWCWKNGIMKVLAVLNGTIYFYDPLPTLRIMGSININNVPALFQQVLQDLQGMHIRTTVYDKVPRVFYYTNKQGMRTYSGYAFKVILTFITKYNGTLKTHYVKDINQFPNLLEAGTIDTFPFAYNDPALFQNISLSFPISFIRGFIAIPYSAELPRHQYLSMPFRFSAWMCIIAVFIVLLVICRAVQVLGGPDSSQTLVLGNIVRIVLQQPISTSTHLKQLDLIIVLGFATSMLLSSLYQSGLSSFYTKSISDKQIQTFEDLIESDLEVLLTDLAYGILKRKSLIPEASTKNMKRVPSEEYQNRIAQMDNKYGYMMTDDEFDIFQQLQRHQSRNLFFTSKMRLATSPIFIPLHRRSVFKDMMNELIFRIFDSGLLEKWKNDIVTEAKEARYIEPVVIADQLLRPLTLYDLKGVWIIFGLANVLSLIVFMVEVVVERRTIV